MSKRQSAVLVLCSLHVLGEAAFEPASMHRCVQQSITFNRGCGSLRGGGLEGGWRDEIEVCVYVCVCVCVCVCV